MRAVLAGARVHFVVSARTPFSVVTSYLSPLCLALVVIARHGQPTPGLVAATMIAGIWNSILLQVFRLVIQERIWGTLSVIAASPGGVARPLTGRLLASIAQGLVTFPLTWISVALLWGIPDMGPLGVTFSALLTATAGLSGAAAVVMGVMARLRFYGGMVNGIFPVTVLLMGIFLPASAVPAPVRFASDIFPPVWALSAIHGSSYRPLAVGALVALAWLAAGYLLLRHLITWMRQAPSAYLA